MEKYKQLTNNELKKLIYPSDKINTPFGIKKVIYADFIASGSPSPDVEKFISKHIYGKYSNTHSNANNGIFMKERIQDVRDIIKKEYMINDDYEILFKGSGCTGAINYLIDCLDYTKYNNVYIFISSYEHYSNHLPWLELSKVNNNIKIYIIPINKQNELNLTWFEEKLNEIFKKTTSKVLLITSIIHCSNLFGYFTPIEKIKSLLDKHKNKNISKYFFCDMACSAPYIKVNGSMFDAFFLSPHKFIGGVETPGLLVAKSCLFHKDHPIEPGGSCIKKTYYNNIEYSSDIETRESAGTPNIIGIIKIGLCYLLKNNLQDLISHNEKILVQIMKKYIKHFKKNYTNFRCIEYDNNVKQLPIFSFNLINLHYNFVVVLLNDLFGIQTRGGRACDGLLSDFIKDKYGINGFCRVSLHWSMSKKDIQNIFSSIEYIIKNGENFKPLYEYNEKDNLFFCK